MELDKHKILGIDPGTNILGYAVLNTEGRNLSIEAMGVFDLRKHKDHTEKLKEIFLQVQEVVEAYIPATLSIEAPFFGKNVQSMLKLGRAQGVCMAAAMAMGLGIYEYSPKRIKKAVTGNGNAAKEQVSSMLGHVLKVKFVDEYLDATDALAAAMCHYHTEHAIVSTHSNKIKSSRPKKSGKKYSDWGSFIANNPDRLK